MARLNTYDSDEELSGEERIISTDSDGSTRNIKTSLILSKAIEGNSNFNLALDAFGTAPKASVYTSIANSVQNLGEEVTFTISSHFFSGVSAGLTSFSLLIDGVEVSTVVGDLEVTQVMDKPLIRVDAIFNYMAGGTITAGTLKETFYISSSIGNYYLKSSEDFIGLSSSNFNLFTYKGKNTPLIIEDTLDAERFYILSDRADLQFSLEIESTPAFNLNFSFILDVGLLEDEGVYITKSKVYTLIDGNTQPFFMYKARQTTTGNIKITII